MGKQATALRNHRGNVAVKLRRLSGPHRLTAAAVGWRKMPDLMWPGPDKTIELGRVQAPASGTTVTVGAKSHYLVRGLEDVARNSSSS